MEPILTAAPLGPWTLMLAPTARHIAATNGGAVTPSASAQHEASGAIASYRTDLVLEAQLIFKLKRRNGAEGHSAINRYDLDISPDGNRQKWIRPALTQNFFSKHGLRVRAQPPHFSWLRPTPKPPLALVQPRQTHQTEKDPEQLQRRSQQAHTIPKLLSWAIIEPPKEAAQASPLTRILAGA